MTTLFQRGPAEEMPRFQLNLDSVTFDRRSIDSAICLCAKFCTGLSVHSAGFLYRQWNFDAAECCKRRR